MDFLINVANVVYLGSYLVRDILWLRVMTVVAASTLVPYFYYRAEPLMAPIYWNLLFISLNVFWIIRLTLERRPVHLTGRDLELYQMVFRCLTPREMKKLLALGCWKAARPGECFIRQGEELQDLMVVCYGKAQVSKDTIAVEELGPGQFIGGIAFITEQHAPANAIALEETHYMSWPKLKLKEFLSDKSELSNALHLTLGFDLSKRLEDALARKALAAS